jgi:tetratricopeptide (TPR) repeat protein
MFFASRRPSFPRRHGRKGAWMPLYRWPLLLVVAGGVWACVAAPAPISPAEIDELAARAGREPLNGPIQLRYAAALRAADRCDEAMPVARRGMERSPADALGPLVLGQCLELAGQHDEAIAVYRGFLAAHTDGRGVGAVRAREQLAVRAGAVQVAREALARESELSQEPADPQTVAVLPVRVMGDSTYQALSRGLAQMLTSDLALLERFRMVERMRLGALLDEMRLDQSAQVDPATAARVGRLSRAGRMVQGLAMIPSEQNVRLEATVILGTGEVTAPARAQGRLRDLLRMEKELVVGVAAGMGYTLSEAERRAVLENGTQNLSAFLAYSRALEAEDRGDYAAAARYYQAATQADPSFRQARDGHAAATATQDAQSASPADAPVLAGQDVAPVADFVEPIGNAMSGTVGDLAPTSSEQVTAIAGTSTTTTGTTATGTTTAQPPPPSVVPPTTIIGTIRIVFRLP